MDFFTHNQVDLASCRTQRHAPCDVIRRRLRETWLVPYKGIVQGQDAEWTSVSQDEFVHVPLVPYLTAPTIERTLLFASQLGMQCVRDARQPIRRAHIVVGVPVEEVTDPTHGPLWRVYLGYALLVE